MIGTSSGARLNHPVFNATRITTPDIARSKPPTSQAQCSARALNSAQSSSESSAALRVSAEVKNTGDRSGEEVVQLYIRERGTSVARPVRELKGFKRVRLGPGESKLVEFTLGREELKFWNIDMKDVVEPATVTVWIGPNSAEGSQAEFEITE